MSKDIKMLCYKADILILFSMLKSQIGLQPFVSCMAEETVSSGATVHDFTRQNNMLIIITNIFSSNVALRWNIVDVVQNGL